jgi:hypothetical protein
VTDFPRIAIHEVDINEDYEVYLDEHRRGQDVFLLVHVRFLRWSPTTFKRLLANMKLLREHVSAPLFALGDVDDDKYERFVTRVGFKFHTHVLCNNGERRRLFIHLGSPSPKCPPTPSQKLKAP